MNVMRKTYQIGTREHAVFILKKLADHFGLPVPRLYWNTRNARGKYKTKTRTIVCGPSTCTGSLPTLVHEFTHYRQHAKYGYSLALVDYPVMYDWHGHEFFTMLKECVQVVYGTTKETSTRTLAQILARHVYQSSDLPYLQEQGTRCYLWSAEYPNVKEMALAEGLIEDTSKGIAAA